MLHPKYFAIAAMVLVASCDVPSGNEPEVKQFAQPMSVSDAVQWLQSEGYDVVAVDRTGSGKLAISSRSSTHRRNTVLDAVSYEVLDDMIQPLQEAKPDNDNKDNRERSTSQSRSDDGEGRTAVADASSTGTNTSSNSSSSASTENGSRASADASSNTQSTTRQETTTRPDGFTETRETVSSSSTGSATSTITVGE